MRFNLIIFYMYYCWINASCYFFFLQALVPEVETDHEHDSESGSHSHENVYKALCGLSTIYFFFLVSRIQTIIANSRMKVGNSQFNSICPYIDCNGFWEVRNELCIIKEHIKYQLYLIV